jgi:Family of unknown function (DUF6496)
MNSSDLGKLVTPEGQSLKRLARKYAVGGKVAKVMHEWKTGTLHSGSKKGPKVTDRKQAIAIALSEKRAALKSKYDEGGSVSTPGTSWWSLLQRELAEIGPQAKISTTPSTPNQQTPMSSGGRVR